MGVYFIAAGTGGNNPVPNRLRTLDQSHRAEDLAPLMPVQQAARLLDEFPNAKPVFAWGATGPSLGQLRQVEEGDYVVDVANSEVRGVFRFAFSYKTPDLRLQEHFEWDAALPPEDRRLYPYVYFLTGRRETTRTQKKWFQWALGRQNAYWLTGQKYFSDEEIQKAMMRTGSATVEAFLGIEPWSPAVSGEARERPVGYDAGQGGGTPRAVPSHERYMDALTHPTGISEHQRQLLRAHYAAPGRTLTAGELADAMTYKSYGAANVHYGRLATILCERLGFEPEGIGLGVLVEFDETGEFILWALRPELARALEELGWVEAPPLAPPAATQAQASASTGQGYGLTGPERKAVERRAMDLAMVHYEESWDVVEDVGDRESYDLRCRQGTSELRVEVKGTTGDGASILLTRNEVDHARDQHPHVDLFVVSNIQLAGRGTDEPTAAGGDVRVLSPWNVDASHAGLRPETYRFRLPESSGPLTGT